MSSETIDVSIEVFLPVNIKQDWIPLDGQSVPHLFQFTRYPPQGMVYHNHPNLSPLLHEGRVANFEPHTLLQLGLPPQPLCDSYKAAMRTASHPIHSFTLIPISGHPVRLPIWVLDYWREIRHAMGYRDDWKTVLEWLRRLLGPESMVEICDQIMAGLSCFPWNGGHCSVRGMVSLLTESYLSDFHIDYALTKISHRHHDHYGIEVSSRHVFLAVIDLDSIVGAYKNGISNARAAFKCKQFLSGFAPFPDLLSPSPRLSDHLSDNVHARTRTHDLGLHGLLGLLDPRPSTYWFSG
jgi:hypothetical protein